MYTHQLMYRGLIEISLNQTTLTPDLVGVESVEPDTDDTDDDTEPRRDRMCGFVPTGSYRALLGGLRRTTRGCSVFLLV